MPQRFMFWWADEQILTHCTPPFSCIRVYVSKAMYKAPLLVPFPNNTHAHVYVEGHSLLGVCGHQRTTCEGWFSPLPCRWQESDSGWPGSATSTFSGWSVSLLVSVGLPRIVAIHLYESLWKFSKHLTMVSYKLTSLVLYFHICKMDLIIDPIS